MDFATLQKRVTDQYDAQALTFQFDPAPFGSSAIDSLLATVVLQQSWSLTGVSALQVDTAGQTVTVAGTCSSFFKQNDAGLTMRFFLDESGTAHLLIRLDLPTTWSFSGAFPQLQGTIFDHLGFQSGTLPKYLFASTDCVDPGLENGRFVTGMNFWGDILPSGKNQAFQSVMKVLGRFVHTTAVGPMQIVNDLPALNLTLGFQKSLEQYFPILTNHAEIQLVCQLGETTSKVGLLLGTAFDFGENKGLELYTLLTPQPMGVLSLVGEFHGVALPSPTQFASAFEQLIGGNDLYQALPDQYQSSSDLLLKRITLGIGLTTLEPALATLEIGMNEGAPGWQLGDLATVSQVSFLASVQNPFQSKNRSITVTVGGALSFPTAGQPVDMLVNGSAQFTASSPSVYTVQAGLAPGSTLTLPVGDLVNKYLPSAVNLPDITLDQLGVDFKFQSPKNHYAIYAGLDKNHPLTFQFGGQTVFALLYANFHIENDSQGGGPGGGMIGGIRIFSVETDFQYQTPGNFKITALIPAFDVSLQELANGLLDTQWSQPDWMPTLSFPQTTLFVERNGSGEAAAYTFAMMAKPSFGQIVLEVLKQPSGWALAAALQLDSPRIAAFDSLHFLQGMDAMFKVNELLFVFTSATLQNGFQFPLSSDFQGSSSRSIQLPNWAGQVKAGFYFYGSMTLNIEQQKNLALVPKLLNLDLDLAFQLYVFLGLNPLQNAFAQAGIQGKINDVTTLSGYIGAFMEDEQPKFYLEGVISTNIQGSDQSHSLVSCDKPDPNDCLTAAVAFELTENAAYLSAALIGSVIFGPITLSDVVIVVGVDFEGIPSLGFAAQIDLKAYNTSYDSSIALFFDSGDPGKSLFAGSISDVTLKQVLDTIVGEVTGGDQPPAWLDDLLAQVGLSGTNSFYLAGEALTALQTRDFTGITAAFNQAVKGSSYSFTRQTTLFVEEAVQGQPTRWYLTDFPAAGVITHYELEQQTDGRIKVSLEPQFYYCMPPGGGSIVLGPPGAGLTFNPGVFLSGRLDLFMLHLEALVEIEPNKGFAADVELEEPVVVIPKYLALTGNQESSRGPKLSLSTYTVQRVDSQTNKPVTLPPHFYLDGKVDLLGLEVATTVNISAEGLLLDFKESVGDTSLGADYWVKTALNSNVGFAFAIGADVHIHNPEFELFDVRLGTLDLKVEISTSLTFGANASELYLHLNESTFTFGDVGFTLPGIDLDLSTHQLEDIPGIIYDEVKNLIWEFLQDAEHFLLWVGKELLQGVEDVEKVLDEVYNAIASVWGNEKRIIVAVSESLTDSKSVTVTVTPSQPTGGVTQVMIDAAHAWAEQTAQSLVTQAIVKQIKQTSPDDVGLFQVNVLQNIDETYDLEQNINWPAVLQAPLSSLLALGYKNPMADPRFYTRTTGPKSFQVSLSVDADFTTVARVTVAVRYNGVAMGSPFTFTSRVPHTFSGRWVAAAGDNFEVQYTVAFLDPGTPPVNTPWLKQKGSTLVIPVPQPSALQVTFDGSGLPFGSYTQVEIYPITFLLQGGDQVPAHMTRDPFLLTAQQPRLTIFSEGIYPVGTAYSYTYQLIYRGANNTSWRSPLLTGKTPVVQVPAPATAPTP